MGGLWTAKRQEGIPLEMSVLELRDKGALPDFLECLLDAGSVELPAFELDSAIKEIESIVPSQYPVIMQRFKALIAGSVQDGEDLQQVCKRLLDEKLSLSPQT